MGDTRKKLISGLARRATRPTFSFGNDLSALTSPSQTVLNRLFRAWNVLELRATILYMQWSPFVVIGQNLIKIIST